MRRIIRWFVVYLAGGLALAIVGEFFIELARECGWYARPSERVDALMSAFRSFVEQPWFLGLAIFVTGLAIGLWFDVFLRRRAPVAKEIVAFYSARIVPLQTALDNLLGYLRNTVLRDTVIADRLSHTLYYIQSVDLKRNAKRLRSATDATVDPERLQTILADYHEAYLFLTEEMHRVAVAAEAKLINHDRYDQWAEYDHEYKARLRELAAYNKFGALKARLANLGYGDDYKVAAIRRRKSFDNQSL